MTQVTRLWPLLTATHRYDKSVSTWQRGYGIQIQAPILAYLIETRQGRILYDVGCDYSKIHDPALRERWYGGFSMDPPQMTEEQRLPAHFARLGLTPADIDLVFLGHLHFDHCGGLCEVCGAEVHVHADELAAARAQADDAYFVDDFAGDYRWKVQTGEYDLVPGVRAIATPGHTAGHMSLLIELPEGRPVILAGDAADLQENLDQEIAPGTLWQEREDLAQAGHALFRSMRRSWLLRRARREERSLVAPNKRRVTQHCAKASPSLRVVPESWPCVVAALDKGSAIAFGLRLAWPAFWRQRIRSEKGMDRPCIRKLKALAGETGGQLWPNHDMAFYQGLKRFPEYHA